jgi:hypothetical protein
MFRFLNASQQMLMAACHSHKIRAFPRVVGVPESTGRKDRDVEILGGTAVVTHNAVFKGRAEDKDVTVEVRWDEKRGFTRAT